MSRQRESYPRNAVIQREQTHRRVLLLGLGVLLLLGMSPLFGHHLPSGAEAYLAGRDHLWALCLIALHMLLAPVHFVFHVLFFGGLLYAVWDRARAWRSMRRVLAPVEGVSPQPGDGFWEAATDAGVRPQDIRVVEGLPTPAFTAGWWRPRIYVAQELSTRLSPAELTAVLAHEGAHVARRDPLRLSLLRLLTCTLFWIPALRGLVEDIADEAEILADDVAARGQPLALASAILVLAQWVHAPRVRHGGVAFNERDVLERRVRRLAGEEATPRSRVTRRSILGAAFALGLAWTSGAVMAHPLPAEVPTHEEHCDHGGASVILHLFCLGFSFPSLPDDCPHRVTH